MIKFFKGLSMGRLRPVFRGDDLELSQFEKSKCLLTISVGQEVHEQEHFEATIDLVNKSFNSCIMLIDDSLQRHTMALESDKNADDFYQKSMEAGDFWLDRNAKYYEKLAILSKIIRWDHWLYHPKFEEQKSEIMTLMKLDSVYQNAFASTIDDFLTRYLRRIKDKGNFDLERARKLCLTYLIEECVAICLWPEFECQFEVYPSRRNLAMVETHKRFVLPKYPDLLHAVAIKFKNRKQFKPQQLVSMKKRE